MSRRAQGFALASSRTVAGPRVRVASTTLLAMVLSAALPTSAEIVRPSPTPQPVEAAQPQPTAAETASGNVAGDEVVPQPAPTPPTATPSTTLPAEATLPPATAPQGNIRWPGSTATPVAEPPSADEGSSDPSNELARALDQYVGRAGQPNYDQAARSFKSAADAGDLRASIAFAYLQAMGLGVPRDPSSARQRLQAASGAGIARADYILSLVEAMERRPQSAQRAGALRESAARRGDAVAENAMGVYYQQQGDRTTAELWYQRAVEHGSRNATQNLANLARSEQVKQQVADTRRTADTGNADALFSLARRYHRGEGVPPDYGQALRLYRAAAAKGSEPARQMLGLIQSRPAVDGQVDPAWMQQLASATVGGPDRRIESPAVDTGVALPKNDDPLSGLTHLTDANASASPNRRIP